MAASSATDWESVSEICDSIMEDDAQQPQPYSLSQADSVGTVRSGRSGTIQAPSLPDVGPRPYQKQEFRRDWNIHFRTALTALKDDTLLTDPSSLYGPSMAAQAERILSSPGICSDIGKELLPIIGEPLWALVGGAKSQSAQRQAGNSTLGIFRFLGSEDMNDVLAETIRVLHDFDVLELDETAGRMFTASLCKRLHTGMLLAKATFPIHVLTFHY